MMRKNAFTLVEMLVVIALMSIFGVLILTIFTRTLKGGNKAQIIGVIKQNGQAVLEQMDKTIRNADNVVCPVVNPPATSASSNNLVVFKNGTYTRYIFFEPSSSTNGYIQQDNPDKQDVAGTNPLRKETDPEFVNRVCLVINTQTNPLNSPVILTDTNPTTGVSVKNGSFTRDSSVGFKDQVTIKFDLDRGVNVPAAIADQIDAVNFQTTVQLR